MIEQTELSRLCWQCRRGMLELDLLLKGFVESHGATLEISERRAFETLLGYPDQMLLEYLMGRMQPADKDVACVVERVRESAGH